MRIITYNVNGIRSAISKGFFNWVKEVAADVICLQEIKASPDQVGVFELEEMGYHHYWYPAQKKGYSGVAIFSKKLPDQVVYGCGIPAYDDEGRVLRADFGDISVMSVYHPSGSSGDLRQAFKMQWLADFSTYVQGLRQTVSNLVLCGDFNICHRPIDIHNPVSNARSSGFLPEERDWMEQFLNTGFIDTFRHFNPGPHHYTWWSYRSGARQKNLGWRIDYHLASPDLGHRLRGSSILPDVVHSDHCPVLLDIE